MVNIMTNKQFSKELFKAQSMLNYIINPTWIKDKWEYGRFAVVETVELMGHLGYKRWAKTEVNYSLAQGECVDVFHFLVSQVIVDQSSGTVDVQADFEDILGDSSIWEDETLTVVGMLNQADYLIQNVYKKQYDSALCNLIHVAVSLGMTKESFFNMYMGKNALNILRQNRGYKTGQYLKNWGINYPEDNMYLNYLLSGKYKDTLITKVYDIYNDLDTYYEENVYLGM